MKHLSTKSIGSLIVAAATVAGNAGRKAGAKQLDRVLRRHDRKGELRAAILGIDPRDMRAQLKHYTLEEIAMRHGFGSAGDFYMALGGKLKAELHNRGWSRHRIDLLVHQKRALTL